MSGPITRTLETEHGVSPSAPIALTQSGTGNSGSLSNTWNINQPMPWLVLCGILAGVAIGMQVRSESVMDAKIAAAIAPANEVARTAAQNAKLAEDRANKMAAMLEARGLIKLENH